MRKWIARYEEGYVSNAGSIVSLTDELHASHPWKTPEDALRHWFARPALADSGVSRFGNGLEQIEDVRDRLEFKALGVTSIWRRVTFEEDLPR